MKAKLGPVWGAAQVMQVCGVLCIVVYCVISILIFYNHYYYDHLYHHYNNRELIQ